MSVSRIHSLLIAALMTLAPVAAGAEGARIAGRVVDQEGVGLSGVSVAVPALGVATDTDAGGRYTLEDVPAGSYDLTMTLGEHALTVTLEVAGGDPVELKTVAEWRLNFAETILVNAATRRPRRIVEAPASVTALTPEEIARRSSHGQLPRMLTAVTGVEAPQSGLYDFSVNLRGFNTFLNRRILTLIDGRDPSIPVFLGGQQWAAISFPLDDLAAVELVRGPGAALYGAGAFNGVLNLLTRAPADSLGGRVRLTGGELATHRIELLHAGELAPGWFFKALGGFNESDDLTRSRVDRGEYQPDLLPTEAIAPILDRNRIVSGGLRFDRLFGDAGDRLLTLEGGTALFEGTTFVTGSGRFHQLDVDRPWARLNLSAPRWNFLAYHTVEVSDDLKNLGSGGATYLDSYQLGLEAQLNSRFSGGRGHLIGGASYNRQVVDTADPQGRQTVFARSEAARNSALFGQVEFELAPALQAVISVRWDDSDLTGSRVSPRAAVVYAPRPRHTLRFTYSDAFQRPTLAQFFTRVEVAPPADLSAVEELLAPILGGVPLGLESVPTLVVGNEQLESEEVSSLEIGYQAILGQKAFLTLSYYRNELSSFVSPILPQVGTSFGRLNPDYGPYAPPAGLSPAAGATVQATLEAALGPQLYPLLSNDAGGSPVFALLSFTNFGRVDTQGLELSLDVAWGAGWRTDLSYSWFDFEVREAGAPLAPNAPENQLGIGIHYARRHLDATLGWRWVDGFEWVDGLFAGPVASYGVADLALSYALNDRWRLGLDLANLLDDRHYEMFGGDLLERRALAHASFSW